MGKKTIKPPQLLVDLLDARSPSGYESEAQKVIRDNVGVHAEEYNEDALGNCISSINTNSDTSIMFSGHIDELGLIVHYIDDKGFLYFKTIGGHDRIFISGRRVDILTSKGIVKGVTGKRAIHLMTPEERKKVPELHQIWIDIGVSTKAEAERLVSIGDVAVYNQSIEMIRGSVGVARAFDNKSGAYIVSEALLRLNKLKSLYARIDSVASSQEEIGCRGAGTAAFGVNPDMAIVVDVGHATDHPDCTPQKHGQFFLGKGPIITRGANIHPKIFERLVAVAKKAKIPYQVEADPNPTGTDARAIQIAGSGVATGLIHIPLRYMHTPSEVVDLEDVENCVKLLVEFSKSVKKNDTILK